jgi:type IV secretion system protein VirB9
MRYLLLAASIFATSPAFALQKPDGSKNGDPRVCDVKYDPNNIVDAVTIQGAEVSIHFGQNEKIIDVAPSDTEHLRYFISNVLNVLWLKAKYPMHAQPIGVRTTREDGATRDYSLQWTALPAPAELRPVRLAANGAVSVEDIGADAGPTPCYTIRYTYAAEFTAAQIAAWKARKAKEAADAAEIALHRSIASGGTNIRYVAQGDSTLAPIPPDQQTPAISDDGFTTTLRFPGNQKIPVILARTAACDRRSYGHEAELTGMTTEQNGVVKIHGTLQYIENRAFNPVGNNPGTGTTSAGITRDVGSR